jgi:hypothetical protein
MSFELKKHLTLNLQDALEFLSSVLAGPRQAFLRPKMYRGDQFKANSLRNCQPCVITDCFAAIECDFGTDAIFCRLNKSMIANLLGS